MPEEELFKTETRQSREVIADELTEYAEAIRGGEVHLEAGSQMQEVSVPQEPRFEVELERLTDSETVEQRYELEFELRWIE